MIRTEPDGTITTIADRYDGKRFNSPNDVVVKSDGSIWFTDPTYAILSDYEGYIAPSPNRRPETSIASMGTTGVISVVVDDFSAAQRMALLARRTRLYIADSASAMNRPRRASSGVFDVEDGGAPEQWPRSSAISTRACPTASASTSPAMSGPCAATACTASAPRAIFSARSLTPQTAAQSLLRRPRRNRLFITATKSLYAVYVATSGAQYP